MPKKISLRLSRPLYQDVQQAARRRRMTPSAFVRLALQQVLGQASTAGGSSPPPGDAWELLLARCPDEVQVAVRRVVNGTGLRVADVLRALLVTAVTGAATPRSPHRILARKERHAPEPG